MCRPGRSFTIARRFVPSALAIHRASPAGPPARTNVTMRLSGDHRIPTKSVSSFLGAPGRGAGISHVSIGEDVPRILAITAIRAPSGEISSPPIPVPGVTSRPADAVRFAGSPPAMNVTHTSVGPRASDRYATHLPSGEIAGAQSRAGPLVSRRIRENEGPRSAPSARDPENLPTKVAASPVTSTPTVNAPIRARGRFLA